MTIVTILKFEKYYVDISIDFKSGSIQGKIMKAQKALLLGLSMTC